MNKFTERSQHWLSIPASLNNGKPITIPIPRRVINCRLLHGLNQRKAVAYALFRVDRNGELWYFNAPELATLLDITVQGALLVFKSLTKKHVFNHVGIKVLPSSARIASYGQTYYKVNDFTVNLETFNTLFIKPKRFTTKKNIEVVLDTDNIPDPDTIKKWTVNRFYGERNNAEGDLMRTWIKAGREDLLWEYIQLKDWIVDPIIEKECQWWTLALQEWGLLPDPELEDLQKQYNNLRHGRSEGAAVAERNHYETTLSD